MVEAAPSAAFIVAQSHFLLQFEIVALDPPAQLGKIDHAFEPDVGCHRGKPVVIRFSCALWPLDQQPLHLGGFAPAGIVVRRADPPPGKPRGQWRVAAVSPEPAPRGCAGFAAPTTTVVGPPPCQTATPKIRRATAQCRAARWPQAP